MEQLFNDFRAFDFASSIPYLWVFKRTTSKNKFTARYAQTDVQLNTLLSSVVGGEIQRITEYANYTYLAETNENSCLAEQLAGSDFVDLKAVIDQPEPDWRVRGIKDLKNAAGYVVKFVHNGRTVYAVKRSAATWKTSYLKTHINIIFNNGELSAAEDNGFAIEKTFDFYVIDNAIFIASKRAFESAMEHRASFSAAFVGLQARQEFSQLFTDMQPLIAYVGTNAIQLRRMARIEERALYNRAGFLDAVRLVNQRRGWGLNFDEVTGQLIPCVQTTKKIVEVLLDHHLLSEVTDLTYVVPDATQT